MKHKAKLLSDRFVSVISTWPSVECIALNEAALPDTLDPYFALILDVYCTGSVPSLEFRKRSYGEDVVALESSAMQNKDRFLVDGLPVHIEYKMASNVENLVGIACDQIDQLWLIKDSGTYMFYRLTQSHVLFQRGDWIDRIRGRLSTLSDEFWIQMRHAYETKMEHFLADLGAAMVQEDDFNYLVSSAGFIKNACIALFCVNRLFESSHRAYTRQLEMLELLPEEFMTRYESFISQDVEMTPARKYSLAQLIARSILSL